MSEDFKRPKNKDELIEEEKEISSDKEEINKEKQLVKKSKPIILRADAYKTIILYASRYANKSLPPEEWKELYVILIGYSD